MMDWGGSYACEWRVYEVNTKTWADGERVGGMTSLKVSRDSKRDIIETGTASLDSPVGEGMGERYLRFVLIAISGNSVQREDIATLLCSSGSGKIDYQMDVRSVSGTSVLYPASTCRITSYGFVSAGANGAEAAAEMLRSCIAAPVSVVGSGFKVGKYVTFEPDDDVLSRVRQLLDMGNHVLMIDGRGEVTVQPMPETPALEISHASARLVAPGVSYRYDLSGVPNRYRAISLTGYATSVNLDQDSPTSVTSRGYYVDEVDRSPKLLEGETLQAYADRMLLEGRKVTYSRSYKRRYWPGVWPSSVVSATMPSVGLDGNMRVVKQVVSCGDSIEVDEEVEVEVLS